jgi:hypothetical protein
MTDISEEYKKMLRELNEELCSSKQPGEFNTLEYAEANDMTRDRARYILDNGVRDKKLTRRTLGSTVYFKAV